jgi:virulence factor
MNTNRLRVGVIGAGNIATIAQLPTLVQRDDVELAALVSRREDPSSLVGRWGFGSSSKSVEDMLNSQDLDAVFVLTPRSEHAHAVQLCLNRDVDVFCEKPLAPATEEAESLADLADERGRVLMVDFNRRYAPVYTAGRELFGTKGATLCVAQKNRPDRNTAQRSKMPFTWLTCSAGTAAANPWTGPHMQPVMTPGKKTASQP